MSGSRKRVLAGIGLAGALLGATACGSASDKIAEKATEKAIENAGGGNVDIDTKDGKVKVSGKDGDVTYETDEDGNVKITGDDGESSYTVGDDAKLPDGWPRDLKLPDGAKLTASSTSASGDGKAYMVTAEISGKVKAAYEDLKSQLTDAGYEIAGDSYTTTGDGDFASLSAKGDAFTVAVSIGSSSANEKPFLSINVAPVTP